MFVAIYGAQYSLPSGPAAMPDHLTVPDRSAPMLVRWAVLATGSMTRMSVALYGAQYSLPSGPAAMPCHLDDPDRFTLMLVRCAVANHITPPTLRAIGANAASPSAT